MDVDEWGQVQIMGLLLRYVRTMCVRPMSREPGSGDEKDQEADGEVEELDKDIKLLLDSVEPVFQSRNPAVSLYLALHYEAKTN